jgi:acyl-CoA dehydrogenase
LGQLELTLHNVLACEPIFNKVCQALNKKLPFRQLDEIADQGLALKVITQDQAELLRTTERGRLAAINVDDFDSKELGSAYFSDSKS